jgi:small ligand-binding sensory domain FIST
VSVLAVRGLDAQPIWVPELAGREDVAAEEIAERLAVARATSDLVVLIPDPRALQPEELLARVRDAVGVGRRGRRGRGRPDLRRAARLVRTRDRRGRAVRARAARRARAAGRGHPGLSARDRSPHGDARQGPWVLELDGRPALEVYREAAREPLADDLRRAAAFVLAALPRDAAAPLAPGGYLVRNIAGFAPDANAFAIPVAIEKGDRIALVHREPETAREDLKVMLAGLGSEPPGLALYFDCCARGAGFFGVPGLESAYLDQALGGSPLAGMFGSCEIGPIAGRAELLTYTGVLALLDR